MHRPRPRRDVGEDWAGLIAMGEASRKPSIPRLSVAAFLRRE